MLKKIALLNSVWTAVLTLALLAGCRESGEPKRASAVLSPTEGSSVEGRVVFIREEEGVRIVAEVTGLTPGKHGFHIHEYGDCSAPDASSAGGHFNPHGKPHAGPDDPERHAGDMGNLEADESGYAAYEAVNSLIELSGPNSIIGKSVIVHEKEDDLKSQPTGDAGSRQACGKIQAESY